MKGGLPTIAVRDMIVHPREGDLVLATFGRGFYILDDITALRQISPDKLQQTATLFPTKDSLLYIERLPLGGAKKGFQGDAFYTADNPPFGAVFTYYLKDKASHAKRKNGRQRRRMQPRTINRSTIPQMTNCGQKPKLPSRSCT